MAKNDDVAAEISKNDADDDYTWGLHNRSLGAMILVTLLFVPLAAVLLSRLPVPASSPVETDHNEPWLPTLQKSVSVVWTVSLLLISYLGFWIYTFSRTMGAAAVIFRVSYPAALAYTAAGLAGPGPAAGIIGAHLATAWVAGLLGYALAEHRMRDGGGESAAGVAAKRTPAVPSEEQELSFIYAVCMSSMVTLFLSASAVCSIFVPGGEQDAVLRLLGISVLVWLILLCWATVVNLCFLHEALVSGNFLARVICYYIGSFILSILFALVSFWLWVYYFGLETIRML